MMTDNNNNNNYNGSTIINLHLDNIKESKQYSSLLPSIASNDYEALKNDIMKNGIKLPLVINGNNVLLDGYTRLKIARELGLKEVPCIVKHYNNELEEKLFVLTVNVHRRHLDTADKLKLALEVMKIKEELYKGKERRMMNLIQFKKNKEQYSQIPNFLGRKFGNETAIPTQMATVTSSTKLNIWEETAKEFGISKDTLSKGKEIVEKTEKDQEIAKLWQEFLDKKRSLDSVYRRVIEKEARANVKSIVEEGKVKVEDLANVTILHGDFREVLKTIPSNSIDLIFTDPPYSEKYLDLVKDLFLLASRVLKPSGYLAIMYGQNHLDEFFKVFESCNSNNKGNNTKLRYYWTIAIHMPDGQELFYPKNAIIRWKPIFIFQKEPFIVLEHRFEDYISRPKPNKDVHEWKQDLESAIHVINSFSNEGSVVLDPMVGTGTTIEASLMLKRRCIVVEKDEELYKMLLRRFSNGNDKKNGNDNNNNNNIK
jgi:DNA modification methylase